MVSAFLGICPGCPTAAHSFVEFLRYYGQDFDGTTMFVDRGELILGLPGEILNAGSMWVVDPFRVGVNAARNLARFAEIKEVFEETFERVIEMIKSCKRKVSLEEIIKKKTDDK